MPKTVPSDLSCMLFKMLSAYDEEKSRFQRYEMEKMQALEKMSVLVVMFIPQRYVLAILTIVVLVCDRSQRSTLSMTIMQMVTEVKTSSEQHIIGKTCPVPDNSYSSPVTSNSSNVYEVIEKERYDWSQSTQGLLLGAYNWGYIASHIPGGLIAERFGGKWVVFFGVLVSSTSIVLTPLAVNVGEAVGLFIIRALTGFGQGILPPAIITMIAHWIPPSERSRFGGLVFGAVNIGGVIGTYFSGLIMANGGDWANVYYYFSIFGLISCLLWGFLCYSTPDSHPFISDKERSYLQKTVVISKHKNKDPAPFKAILRSFPMWALVIADIGHRWGIQILVTVLPKYFNDVLKFNIKQIGQLASLPSLARYIFCFGFGCICDYGIKKNWHSITTARKLYVTLMATGSGIAIMLASYSGCDRSLAVAFFIVGMSFMAAHYVSVKINTLDFAPNYAGTCTATTSSIGHIVDIISPYIFGLMTPDQTVDQWRAAFWVTFGVLVSSNVIYLIWGSGEQQWWDDVDKYGYPATWKHGLLKKRSQAHNEEDSKKYTFPTGPV